MNEPNGNGEFVSSADFSDLFPFYLTGDGQGCVEKWGPSLAKLCPELASGVSFSALFEPFRPAAAFEVETLRNNPQDLYVIRHRGSQIMLRGQMRPHATEGFIFIGSPWLSDPSELTKHKLSVSDFAIHDPAIDLLHVLRSQKMATADLQRLTDKLTTQRTKLKEANARLTAQEAETRTLALIAERTDNAVVLTNAHGQVEWINPGFTRLTGYTFKEISGKSPGDLLQGPETDPSKIEYMRERIVAGKGFRIQILNYTKSNRKYWVDFEVQPIRSEAGELQHFMAIQTDISARRSAEANLRVQFRVSQILAADTSLKTIATPLLEAITAELNWSIANLWMADLKSQVLTRTATWGQDPELSERFLNLANQDQLSFDSCLPELCSRSQKLQWVEDMGEFPDCSRSSAASHSGLRSAVGFPIKIGDQTLGVVELLSLSQEPGDESQNQALEALGAQIGQFVQRTQARDELKMRSEELARLNSDLAAANRTKDEFLASISHEIRTPLNGVIGAAEAIQPTALNREQREALEIVSSSAHHLHAVLNDVLDFSRIEAGHVELLPEATALSEFIQETARIFTGVARDKQLDFRVVDQLPANTTALIDTTRLRQIIVNLLGNAFKFTHRGSVTFLASVQGAGKQGCLTIEITDTGIGIPADRLEQLFKPFSQLDASRTRKYGGTGLGLAISRHLSTLMGGTLDIDRTHTPGSRFRLQLPAPLASLSPRNTLPPISLNEDAKILIVDDNQANGLVLKMLLKRLGLVGHHSFSARDAIDYCKEETPAIILMDLHMPEMDGMEATRVLNATVLKDRAPTVPIIALTADVRREVKDACFEAGMDGFLTKPIRLEDLREALAKHLTSTSTGPLRLVPIPPAPSAIDATIVDNIFDFGDDPELAAEVREMFTDMWADVEPCIEEIDSLRKAEDVQTAQARCHRLRGVLANYGFSTAAKKLGEMEHDRETLNALDAINTLRSGLVAARIELIERHHYLA